MRSWSHYETSSQHGIWNDILHGILILIIIALYPKNDYSRIQNKMINTDYKNKKNRSSEIVGLERDPWNHSDIFVVSCSWFLDGRPRGICFQLWRGILREMIKYVIQFQKESFKLNFASAISTMTFLAQNSYGKVLTIFLLFSIVLTSISFPL